MPELHPRQQWFAYSARVLFTKHRESIQKFRETSNLKHIDKNKLDEAYFAYSAAYSGRK